MLMMTGDVDTRGELRREIQDDTRLAFHRLLHDVPDTALGVSSDNPAWTVGEVLYRWRRT
jgi:hypothetical protein